MDKLQLSLDSIDTIPSKKRLRVEDSEDETDLLAKKRQSSFSEQSKIIKNDNAETISDKNNIDICKVKEEKYELCQDNKQTLQDTSLSQLNINKQNKEKKDGKLKQENENESLLDKNNVTLNNNPEEINVKIEIFENEEVQTGDNEGGKEEMDETIGKENNKEERMKEQYTTKRRTMDTEVVDGLELSVECASDKDESTESEDEKNVKSWPKTTIVKAEPNESELDCSSDGEKSDSQRALVDTLEIKSEKSKTKKRGSRTSFSKLKVSGSEDSRNSISDEDYSPRRKKFKKSSLTTRKSINKHRSVESKRGRGKGIRGNSHKKSTEYTSNEDEDTYATVDKADKMTKAKNGMEKESSSKDESDNNSGQEDGSSMQGRKRTRNNAKPQNRHIQALKKYLNVAGVKVKCYNEIWADCKSNAAKIKRLKELLEKNGVSGRPTLEKCKRVREENEKLREVSELDTSNIISEGRVTRARRNMGNVNKSIHPPDTPTRHRQTRIFRRIQTVVDSDSE